MTSLPIIVLLIIGFFLPLRENKAGIRSTMERTFWVRETKQGWEPIAGKTDCSESKTYFSNLGLPLQEEIYQNGKLRERLTYYYQQKHLLAIHHNSYGIDSVVSADIVQGYFHEIYPSKINLHDGKNTLVSYRIHTYNNQNQRTKTVVYTPSDEIVEETNFQYDSKNSTTRITRVNNSTKTFVYIDYKYLSYDGSGNWTRRLEITDSKEPVLNIRTIEYY